MLNLINMRVPAETLQASLNQSKHSLMASDSSGRKVAELLLSAEDTVNRTQVLNLKSFRTIQHLQVNEHSCHRPHHVQQQSWMCNSFFSFFLFIIYQHVVAQLEREQRSLHPESEITQDLLSNITSVFSTLEEIKEVSRHFVTSMIWNNEALIRLKWIG